MKGLSYTEPMVLAWNAGLKDLTRRLMTPQPPTPQYQLSRQLDSTTVKSRAQNGHYCWMLSADSEVLDQKWIRNAYREGETLYIKETWCPQQNLFGEERMDLPPFYRATHGVKLPYLHKWHSPMLMPQWASRSFALVISIRPEQIQSITVEDVKREGIVFDPAQTPLPFAATFYQSLNDAGHIGTFRKLWDSIHPGSWERNDWVWRIELKKVDRPIPEVSPCEECEAGDPCACCDAGREFYEAQKKKGNGNAT